MRIVVHPREAKVLALRGAFLGELTLTSVSGSFDIALPNARRDITYPGALLLANQNLVEGVSDPLVVPKASRKLTIDLPSLTDDNSIVSETMDYAGVSAAGDPAMDANFLMADSLSAVPTDVDVPLSLPGVTALPGVPMDKGLGEWYRFDQHFFYKLMKYHHFCFQCSIHTILANLGYMPASDSTVEDLWNQLHGDLNASSPNEEQIHSYLAQTFELGKKGVV